MPINGSGGGGTGASFFLGPRGVFRGIDWFLFLPALMVSLLGLATMHSFSGENAYFEKQVVWIAVAVIVFLAASIPEYRFLRRTPVVVSLYTGILFLLVLVFLLGTIM